MSLIQWFPVLTLLVLLSGCSSSEPVTTDSAPMEVVDESPVPAWFAEGQTGGVVEGVISGYGKAAGTSEELAARNARMMAIENFRYWTDRRLEEARKSGESGIPALSEAGFIKDLRNAVQAIEISDLSFRSGSYEADGVVYAVVRAEIPAGEVLSQLGSALSDYPQAWAEISGSDSIREWQSAAGG